MALALLNLLETASGALIRELGMEIATKDIRFSWSQDSRNPERRYYWTVDEASDDDAKVEDVLFVRSLAFVAGEPDTWSESDCDRLQELIKCGTVHPCYSLDRNTDRAAAGSGSIQDDDDFSSREFQNTQTTSTSAKASTAAIQSGSDNGLRDATFAEILQELQECLKKIAAGSLDLVERRIESTHGTGHSEDWREMYHFLQDCTLEMKLIGEKLEQWADPDLNIQHDSTLELRALQRERRIQQYQEQIMGLQEKLYHKTAEVIGLTTDSRQHERAQTKKIRNLEPQVSVFQNRVKEFRENTEDAYIHGKALLDEWNALPDKTNAKTAGDIIGDLWHLLEILEEYGETIWPRAALERRG
ncbi:hypothetical protein H072_9413 [Dactylellina haptotyla CBS 200.50]|uniref:Uncharacterized protein n=1 Tax=Dactylellina haptotyla (strain CBS 200.50) TaxID=1284197 RepID=S8BCR9_DACHA|nr:hypothetical protein H072_9413 [Dactylellina haptotyla CBS 200.50]